MLGHLIPRGLRGAPAHTHDHLFTDVAPGSATASARLLSVIYEQYQDAPEAAPPQYTHFRALVKALLDDDHPRRLRALSGEALQRVRAAYVCCFEPSAAHVKQLASYWADPAFMAQLVRTRENLVADLHACAEAQAAQRAYLARLEECQAAPIDLQGETPLALIQQMGPDDWHEIVLNWNWDHGITELEWITAQHICDRATAIAAYCAGAPSKIATRWAKPAYEHGRWDYGGFVRAVGARLENGFYMNADLGLTLPAQTMSAYAREIAVARGIGVSPWLVPDGLLEHHGRAHAPKYAITNGRVHYHYDHWLAAKR